MVEILQSGQESSRLAWKSAGGPGECPGCLEWSGRLDWLEVVLE